MPSNSSRNVRAGGAFVELFMKDGAFDASLRRVGQKLKTFGRAAAISGGAIAGAGSAVMSGMGLALKHFLTVGGAIDKAAIRTGIAVESLSTLAYAAEQSDASLEDLSKGIAKMQNNLDAARNGSESAAEMFTKLGLSAESLSQMSPDEQFRTIADAIDKIEDPAAKTAAAMDLFGKSGLALVPMMQGGREAIEGMEQRAHDLNLQMSGESAASATLLGDLLADLWSVIKGGAYTIGSSLAPALISMTNHVVNLSAVVLGWMKENSQTIVVVAKMAGAVFLAGNALVILGAAIFGTGVVLSSFMAIAGAVAAVFGVITSPLTIVLAGLAGLVYWSGAGGEAVQWLSEQFAPLAEFAVTAFEAIKNAMAAGEYQAAANVLWSALRLAWTQGTAWLSDLWRSMSGGFMETFKGTIDVLRGMWGDLVASVSMGLYNAQNATAKWIIKAQQTAGAMSAEEASGALQELDSMAEEAAARIKYKVTGSKEAIEAEAEARREQAREEQAKAAEESAKAVAEAQAEYDAALEAARNAKPKATATTPGKKGGPGEIDFDGVNNTVAATQAKSMATVSGGTFSSLASQIFGAGKDDTAKKQLTALQSIDKKIGNIGTEWQS